MKKAYSQQHKGNKGGKQQDIPYYLRQQIKSRAKAESSQQSERSEKD